MPALEYQFADVIEAPREEDGRKCDDCAKPAVLWLHHHCLCARCYLTRWNAILRETRRVA